jgi:hypothetical protein
MRCSRAISSVAPLPCLLAAERQGHSVACVMPLKSIAATKHPLRWSRRLGGTRLIPNTVDGPANIVVRP